MLDQRTDLAPARYWQVEETRPSLRDVLVVFFRHIRLILWTFAVSLLLAIIYIVSLPNVYETQAQFLITRDRADPVVSADASAVAQRPSAVSLEELNSEMQLLRSRDLLERLASEQGLQSARGSASFVGSITGGIRDLVMGETPGGADSELVIRELQKGIQVSRIRDSNTIRVSYASTDPRRATTVLEALCTLYLDKHVEVRRRNGAHGFFQEQSARYQAQLEANREELARFNKRFDIVSADSDKEATNRQVIQLELDLARASIDLRAATEREASLEQQLGSTASRVTTEVRTSPRLVEEEKAALLDLQRKRTELLQKFQPTYVEVVEVEKQIEQSKVAIDRLAQSPLQEEATNANPTHQLVESELVSARSEVAGLIAKVERLREAAEESRARLARLDQLAVKQRDLLRNVSIEENNYLTSVQRQEQARLSDALDHERILNVAVAEYPSPPVFPSGPNRPLLFVIGITISILLSIGLAVIRDYFATTFRTPEEVESYLGIPVVASIPKR